MQSREGHVKGGEASPLMSSVLGPDQLRQYELRSFGAAHKAWRLRTDNAWVSEHVVPCRQDSKRRNDTKALPLLLLICSNIR